MDEQNIETTPQDETTPKEEVTYKPNSDDDALNTYNPPEVEPVYYTITFSNGAELTGLTKNEDSFVSQNFVNKDTYAPYCSPVMITNDHGLEETHEMMVLSQVMKFGNLYYIRLRDATKIEKLEAKVDADAQYIASLEDIANAAEYAEEARTAAAAAASHGYSVRVSGGKLVFSISNGGNS